jgi:hypothetical protein
MTALRKTVQQAVFFALFIAAAAAATPPPFHSQQAQLWCWAAASQMVLEPLSPGTDFSQALQAEKAIKICEKAPRDTCGNSSPIYLDCDRPGFPSFDLFNYKAEEDHTPLPWQQLKGELDACRPMVFGWCLPHQCGDTLDDSSGHWMVAAAADVCPRPGAAAVPIVRVFNPAPCCNGKALWIPYSLFASGGATMDFWKAYYRVRPDGMPAPTAPGAACRLSDQAASPDANFEIAGDPNVLVLDVLKSCFGAPNRWKSSSLLRPPLDKDDVEGQPVIAASIQRHLISVAAMPGLHGNRAQWQANLDSLSSPALWVFPIRIGGQPVASVVLEEWRPHQYRLHSIEDSESARRLLARLGAAAGGSHPAPDEFVLIETGLPFSYAAAGGGVAVVAADIDCSKPKAGPPDVLIKDVNSFFNLLQPLAAPFAPP